MENGIYQAIVRQNITQSALAKRIGIKREYLNRIINRKVTPTIPLGLRISKALGIPIEDLFFLEQQR